MDDWQEGWLRRGLADMFGPSWRSTLLGLLSILTGLLLFLIGWATREGSLKVMGLGLIPTGILGLVTRDNSASTAAHDESLAKIAAAEQSQRVAHHQNVQAIAAVSASTEQVAAHVAEKSTQATIDVRLPKLITEAVKDEVHAQVQRQPIRDD